MALWKIPLGSGLCALSMNGLALSVALSGRQRSVCRQAASLLTTTTTLLGCRSTPLLRVRVPLVNRSHQNRARMNEEMDKKEAPMQRSPATNRSDS